ncbi:hypothetical protein HDV00_002373 [Rhizophlyctis rosea]|nr:hypothetical protein HDV00_002373 [Rhizophlyctis rosea]
MVLLPPRAARAQAKALITDTVKLWAPHIRHSAFEKRQQRRLEAARRAAAAVRIQAVLRGLFARKELLKLKAKAVAATRIQACFRGLFVRKQLVCVDDEHKGVVCRALRCRFQLKLLLLRRRIASRCIQGTWRRSRQGGNAPQVPVANVQAQVLQQQPQVPQTAAPQLMAHLIDDDEENENPTPPAIFGLASNVPARRPRVFGSSFGNRLNNGRGALR